ncbi:DUF481 domain-containing protein [Alkalilimnicola sp. S0819]|uniref:DUF481 domain-containing protein n=1 Tax=Alkalilimnicola sp. S0819 TaxID=2613922 RepID=UPI0012627B9A|nr:DUF481 domain-containing protein [Alkalilimnicola sp. S0819]KAB7623210.1 DUF481 domain-containing protein [Alkalilimnicola sp. S0819]MPQ17057.1 DUF481 domain-containing protein [Alkalilimnicola sp. S0819]
MSVKKTLTTCALSLATFQAQADLVILQNGDRLSGTVQALEAGTLRFETAYGGTLELPWAQVLELRTDDTVRVQLQDGELAEGRLQKDADGELRLQSNGAERSLAEARLAAINPPPAAPTVEQTLRLQAGATMTRGNTETESYALDGEYVARSTLHRLRVYGEANYGKEDDVESVNNALLNTQYDRFIDEHWYATANLNFSRDLFKNLSLRSAAGVGVGYQFWDTRQSRLSAEAGVNYVHEDYEVGPSEDFPAGRWAVDWEHTVLGNLTLFHRQDGLVRLDETADWLLRTRTGARVPLSERITGSLQVNYDYDNRPAADAEKEDWAYLVKIGYSW